MAKKITNKDLFGANLFKPAKQNAEDLLDVLKGLKNEFKSLAKEAKKAADIDLVKDQTKALQEFEKTREAVIKQSKTFEKVNEQEKKTKKELKKLTDEEIKDKIKLQKQNRQRKKELEAEIILQKKELNSLNDLREANKALRIERDRLDIDKDADRIAELNDQIDENTEKIKGNVDALSQQKINIGNYKDSVKEALEETGAFSGILGKLDATTQVLVQGFQNVIQSLKEQKEATEEAGKAAEVAGSRLKKLNTIVKAGVVTALIAALTALVTTFAESRKGARELEIATQQLANVVKIIGLRLIEVAKAIGDVYVKAFDVANRKYLEFQKNLLTLKQLTNPLKDYSEEIKKVNEELERIGDVGIIDIYKEVGAIVTKSIDAFEGAGDAIASTTPKVRELLEAEDRLIDRTARLNLEIEKLAQASAIQQQIADDSTRSFSEQEKAIKSVIEIEEQRLRLAEEAAKLEQDQAVLGIRIALEREGISQRFTDAQIRNLEFLKDVQAADAVQVTDIDRLRDATIGLTAAETERLIARRESVTQLNEIERDAFEQQLDFAIDAFDNQKTINEQLIAEEDRTFEERFQILRKTQKLNETSFQNQLDLVEGYIRESNQRQLELDLQLAFERRKGREATEAELAQIQIQAAEQANQIVQDLNLEALTGIEDEAEIRKRLLDLGFTDEITNARILEIIKERKLANQDLAVAEKELGDAFEESAEKSIEARRALRVFREETAATLADEELQEAKEALKEAEKFDIERFNAALDALERRKQAQLNALEEQTRQELANIELSEDEKILIQEQAAEKRRLILKDSLDEEQELRDEANDKAVEAAKQTAQRINQVLDALNERSRERSEERIEAINDEIEASQEREREFKELAKERIIDSDKNIAEEQRRQAELELQREREEQRQQRRELAFTALKTYTAKVEAGDKNPLVSTLSDVSLLLAAVQGLSLPGFYEGTELVEDALKPQLNTGKDDYIIRVDGKERILNPEQNAIIGDMSNDQLVNIVDRFNRGEMLQEVKLNSLAMPFQTNTEILRKFDELKQTVQSLPDAMPTNSIDYDTIEKAVIDTEKRRNKVIRNHKKIGGIWGNS